MKALTGSGMNELIVILIILGLIESAIGNLAVNKPADQSSTEGNMTAGNAVDGITSDDNKVSKTETETDQWWRVDLGDIYYVTKVVLHDSGPATDISVMTSLSQTDPSRSSHLWIQRSNHSVDISNVTQVPFWPAAPARFVALFRSSQGGISLREVEVFGFKNSEDIANLALNQAAAQSSTLLHYSATLGVNGDIRDFTHTVSARGGTPRWFRVDLGGFYQVETVILYNRPDECCKWRLRNFTIGTSDSNAAPSNLQSPVTECYYKQDTVGSSLYVTCEPRRARYIIIYTEHSNSTDAENVLSLAEVKVYEQGVAGPTGVSATYVNASCVQVTWQQVSYLQGEYQVKCGNGGWINTTQTMINISELIGPVACSVRAEIAGGFTMETTDIACTAPSPPNCTVNETASGTSFVNLQIICSVLTTNCQPLLKVQLKLLDATIPECSSVTETEEMQRALTCFDLDPFTTYKFQVTATNLDHRSSSLNLTYSTMGFAPSDNPEGFTVLPLNASCLSLSWSPPKTPNGNITQYQVNCYELQKESSTSRSQNVTSLVDLSLHYCNFSAGSHVNCSVMARNSAGLSPAAVMTTRTNCTNPSQPQFSISSSTKMNGSRERINLTVSWQIDTPNCDNISIVHLEIWRSSSEGNKSIYTLPQSVNGTYEIPDLDPYTNYTLTIHAWNNENFTSSNSTVYTTPELAPYDGPTEVAAFPLNSTCISLTWKQPENPNGRIIEYQVNCYELQKGSQSQSVTSFVNLTSHFCNFSAGSRVNCSVMARNSAGLSPAAVMTTRTNCTNPSQPQFSISNSAEMIGSSRMRINLTVSWQIDTPNCDNISIVRLEIERSPSGNDKSIYTLPQSANGTYEISDLDPYTNYTLTIHAWNNENFSLSNSKVYATPELAPYDGPTEAAAFPLNSTCVSLTWKQPKHPNGRIIEYQVNCYELQKGSQNQNVTSFVDLTSQHFCNFSAGSHVNCSVMARNSAGFSPAAVMTTRTNCTNPSQPQFSISNSTEMNGLRMRINLSVTWQIDTPNCDNISIVHLEIERSSSEGNKSIYTLPQSAKGTYEIPDLDPYTNYTLTIHAWNNENFNSSNIKVYTTPELAPYDGPSEAAAFPLNSACISLTWKQPKHPNGRIIEYQVNCYEVQKGSQSQNLTSFVDLSSQFCNFLAGSHVNCSVMARNSAGFSPAAVMTTRTNCTNPSQPQFSISNSTEMIGFRRRINLTVSWQIGMLNCDNISIVHLEIERSSGEGNKSIYTLQLSANGTHDIPDLDPHTNYTLTIHAWNNENFNSSNSKVYLTPELAPYDPPQNINIRPINGSCVKVNWDEPRYPNGVIIQYNVTCTCANFTYAITVTEQPPGKLEHELCGLPSGQKVNCSVQSRSGGGYGPAANGSGFTNLEVRTLPQLEIMSGANKVILRRAELLSKVKITTYHVVMNRKLQAASRFKRELVYENITLLNYDEAKELKQSEYIAAAIKPSEFTNDAYELALGDNKLYNGYQNIPLDQPEYMIRTGFCVQVEADVKCMYPCEGAPFKAHTPDQRSVTGIAIGTSIAGLALLILATVGLVFFIRRRRKPTKESDAVELSTVDKTDKNMKRLTSATNASQKTSSVRKYEELQTPLRNASNQKERYDQLTLPSKSDNVGEPDQTEAVTYERISECIPLDRLEAYVENGEKRIFSQYEVLPDKPSGEMIFACIPENRGKSRYKGLYPVDEFRVRLLEPAPSRTDFINASFIEGVSEDKAYIAAQGPMAATLDDFWLMIWQEKPSAIVMVTKCWEDGKAKCEQYWPEKQGSVMEFGNITVQLSSEELWASFGMRSLKVTKAGTSFTFKQFQYFGWPDHGVPVEIASFVTFYRKVKAYSKMIKKALVVHCSAGVGRTGTFIAMDYLLNQATAFNMVDPFECVMAMRKRRPSMIQTKEQYLFLHKVVLEALSTEKFRCNPVELGKRVAAFGSSLEIDMITQEFQHIEMMVEKTEMQFEAGKLLSNKGRNRIEDILPHDAYRPFLTGTNGDYINAVFVNSHKEKEKMVATQLPLVNTVQDFWQLIHDQKSVTIIQLRAADEPYYPEQNRTMKLKSGLLSNTCIETQDHFQLVHLTQKTAENSEKKILLYQFFGWKSKHLPDTDSFFALFEHLQKYQQQTDSHKIIVTCGDGASRCGMFICAFNVIERLRMEQEVDVYNEVLLARLRRPQFVSTSQQYLSLYKILNKYVDGFSEYSNFT